MNEYKGHYIGPIEHLAGETAILHLDGYSIKAQFDNQEATMIDDNDCKLDIGFNWHKFPRTDWQIDYLIGAEHA